MLDDEVLQIAHIEARRYTARGQLAGAALRYATLGVAYLADVWSWTAVPSLRLRSAPCSDAAADVLVITGADGISEICPVEPVAERPLEVLSRPEARVRRGELERARSGRGAGGMEKGDVRRMVVYRHTRYLFDTATRAFRQLEHDRFTDVPIAGGGGGGGALQHILPVSEAQSRQRLVGRNLIEVPMPPNIVLLAREAMHPFVVFQLWAIGVWLSAAYYPYSAFIFVTATATTLLNFWEVRKNLLSTQKLAQFSAPVVVVRRGPTGGALRSVVDSTELVPGDVIELENGHRLPCDAVLLEGSVTVNEAMLTGESTVVIKAPLPRGTPSANAAEPRNTLFGGSLIVQLRVPPGSKVHALVVRTGFETVKGRLVLAILYPRPTPFKFIRQSYIFIAALGVVALAGFAFNAKTMLDYGASGQRVFQRGCDMVTIVVPPALPLALTVGVAAALVSLRRQKVFCISPPRINLAGKINVFCFDKTGTLTSEGLDLAAVVPAARAAFGRPAVSREELGDHPILRCLATCHSLTRVDGELAGDPLELQTFAFTHGVLTEPHHGSPHGAGAAAAASQRNKGAAPILRGDEICHVALPPNPGASSSNGTGEWSAAVVQQFEFVPALQRMGVLIREGGTPGAAEPAGPLVVLVKGSPEMIHSLCRPDTIPRDYDAVLRSYTRRGFRVIAAAAKLYDGPPASSSPAEAVRASAERNLAFLGLVVLENSLKKETPDALRALREQAGIPVHMVTGDNPVSAICVARECGIVEARCRVFLGDLRPGGGTAPSSPAAAPAGAGSPRPRDSAFAPLFQQAAAGASAASEDAVEWVDVDSDAAFGSGGGVMGESGEAAPAGGHGTMARLDPRTLLPLDGTAGTPYRLALTGRAFRHLLALHRDVRTAEGVAASAAARQGGQPPPSPPAPTLFLRAVMNCAVFARMAPEDKAALVEELAATGMYVGMCGDGANDSLALRAAHVGISLSQVESSVSAPFTSSVPNISCVPAVLREGRAALTTAFNLFLFMALYSTIQFSNALFAISSNSILSNNQYLYQDLFIVFIISLSLGATPAATQLTRKRPSAELLSLYNLTLCAGFIALTFAAQAGAYLRLLGQPWYPAAADRDPSRTDLPPDPEGLFSWDPVTSAVFLVAMFQYIGTALIFSLGHPWLRPPWFNRPFSVWIVVSTLFSLLVLLAQDRTSGDLLSLLPRPTAWSNELLAWGAGSVASYVLFIAGLSALKRQGVFAAVIRTGRGWYRSWLGQAGPRPLPLHKRVRGEWAAQFAAGAKARSLSDIIFKDRGGYVSGSGTPLPRVQTPGVVVVPSPFAPASASAKGFSAAVPRPHGARAPDVDAEHLQLQLRLQHELQSRGGEATPVLFAAYHGSESRGGGPDPSESVTVPVVDTAPVAVVTTVTVGI